MQGKVRQKEGSAVLRPTRFHTRWMLLCAVTQTHLYYRCNGSKLIYHFFCH
jgi:hypothetical protein